MYAFEGFIIGLLGSLHCIGMCGPIVLVLPFSKESNWKKLYAALSYNLGRSITYALMGLVFGMLGLGIRFSGVQQWVSIVFGVIMILSVLIPGLLHLSPLQNSSQSFMNSIKKKLGEKLKAKSSSQMWTIGLLNGLLPCGLVYIAISGAITAPKLSESVLFMFLFGLGTLPVMFALVYFSGLIKDRFMNQLRKIVPFFIVLIGALFILRGLNLGIPYISPKMTKEKKMECCH